jgi:protein TonB
MKFINDLKKSYHIIFQSGVILALLLVLFAFKIPTDQKKPIVFPKEDPDITETIDPPITKQKDIPAKPPKPSVVTEVPNDEIIEDPIGDLDINWEDGEGKLALPEEPKDEIVETIFLPVEQQPKMKGGIKSLYKKITYPRKAKLAGIEGTVLVQFIVATDGSVKDAKILRGIGGGCDKEALRVVKELEFEPGRQRGKAVPVRMSIPVIFKLK